MSLLSPKRYFSYLSKLYIKNLLSILFGLSFAFAAIDYFQYAQKLDVSGSYQILYIFYRWQYALGLIYPLAIVFALITTQLTLVKNNTMVALYAFGYTRKVLLSPFLMVSFLLYGVFVFLHTTAFSYSDDKAYLLLEKQIDTHNINNLFFKYNDTFVYAEKLDPIAKKISNITIFKVKENQVRYTIHAPIAVFNGAQWDAKNAILKTHIYKDGALVKYTIAHKKSITTLKGYKPKMIESLYEGKALNIVDAYNAWRLLRKQKLNSDKIRAALYNKVIMPTFSIALLMIIFFKLPFHVRMMNFGKVTALSIGATFLVWGILFELNQIGSNGVFLPEATSIFPLMLLWGYALYLYFLEKDEIA